MYMYMHTVSCIYLSRVYVFNGRGSGEVKPENFSLSFLRSREWLFHPVPKQHRHTLKALKTKRRALEEKIALDGQDSLLSQLQLVNDNICAQEKLWRNIDAAFNYLHNGLMLLEARRSVAHFDFQTYEYIMTQDVIPGGKAFFEELLRLLKSERVICETVLRGERRCSVDEQTIASLRLQQAHFLKEHCSDGRVKPAQNHFIRKAVNRFSCNVRDLLCGEQ